MPMRTLLLSSVRTAERRSVPADSSEHPRARISIGFVELPVEWLDTVSLFLHSTSRSKATWGNDKLVFPSGMTETIEGVSSERTYDEQSSSMLPTMEIH